MSDFQKAKNLRSTCDYGFWAELGLCLLSWIGLELLGWWLWG